MDDGYGGPCSVDSLKAGAPLPYDRVLWDGGGKHRERAFYASHYGSSLIYGSDSDDISAPNQHVHPEDSECENCGAGGVCTLLRPLNSDVVDNTVEACHVYNVTGSNEGGHSLDGEYHLQVYEQGDERGDVAPFTFVRVRRHEDKNGDHAVDHAHSSGVDVLLRWRDRLGEGGHWAIEMINDGDHAHSNAYMYAVTKGTRAVTGGTGTAPQYGAGMSAGSYGSYGPYGSYEIGRHGTLAYTCAGEDDEDDVLFRRSLGKDLEEATIDLPGQCPGTAYLWRYPEETSDSHDACTYSTGGHFKYGRDGNGECWNEEIKSCVPVNACRMGGDRPFQKGGGGPHGSLWQEWDDRIKSFGTSKLQVRCVQDRDAQGGIEINMQEIDAPFQGGIEINVRKLHTVFSHDMNAFECTCFAGYSGSGDNGNCLPVACPRKSHGINVPSGCFCNPGYSGVVIATDEAPFYEESCELVKCPRNTVGVFPFCRCVHGFHGRIAPTMISPFFSGHCKVNKCVCEDGVAAKGGSWLQVDKANMPAQAGTGQCQAAPFRSVFNQGVLSDACCEEEGREDCAVCNPHFRMEYDATGKRGKCIACPLATFNLATQFQPLHQVGIYADAGRYYSVTSPHHRAEDTEDATTCQLDRDDFCHEIKSDCDDTNQLTNCDPFDSIRHQCWASAKCEWFPAEQICSLRDPCVRKMKRACRKASHCSWEMDKGRCFEEEAISSKDTLTQSSKCDRKDQNGCITDFFCKWTKNGNGCGRHPCRFKNKDSCDEPQCRWNSRHTRCDTIGNSWSRSIDSVQTPTAAASPETHNANWQWEHGKFVETDSSLLDIPKHFRGTPLAEELQTQTNK